MNDINHGHNDLIFNEEANAPTTVFQVFLTILSLLITNEKT